ncbi:MAG: gamma-glutamyltransferase family protein [Burkholderiaceae bacterium]
MDTKVTPAGPGWHAPFDWHRGYPTPRTPVFARNVVATSQPLAAQAGLHILRSGGNAIDATIAAAAAIAMTEPVSNGLGSDAFAIVWDGQQLHGLNASGVAPAAWDKAYFNKRHGEAIPLRGVDTVTVPGAVAGWAALHEKFGRLPMADILAPAIELAEKGYAVAPMVQRKWANQIGELDTQPGFAEVFMPRGRAPLIGERITMPGAAATLKRLAQYGAREYYEGQTGEQLAAYIQQHGGSLTAADLAAYQPEWSGTISRHYRGYDVHEIPPNGQGIAALMAMGMLEKFDVAGLDPDSVQNRHLQIEAMKAAFADVYKYVGDPRSMTRVTADDLLDDAYLASRAALIDPNKATDFGPGDPPRGGTIYLTAADDNGMMVSFIQSNYMGFGSGVVAPELGISCQNRGQGFSLKDGSPNLVAPGMRPFHTIIPGFLMRDGKPQMSFGVMGGNMQPQGHMQTVSRMVDHGQNPQAACDAPRWKVNRGLALDVEDSMERDVVNSLRQMGHQIERAVDSYMDFGSGQFIWRLSDDKDDGYVAASDSRRDGHAAGF